ncbi:hypothetical protein [Lacticaseibacillus kribbianus]|uniref:hypothetical protein n=1 Tax=Lacticaseibacillus kribbianus TaxID=2926292 RepID=UPI001CD1F640|nr:hypothetical protein [Lacticaseibacillus kribbianus]
MKKTIAMTVVAGLALALVGCAPKAAAPASSESAASSKPATSESSSKKAATQSSKKDEAPELDPEFAEKLTNKRYKLTKKDQPYDTTKIAGLYMKKVETDAMTHWALYIAVRVTKDSRWTEAVLRVPRPGFSHEELESNDVNVPTWYIDSANQFKSKLIDLDNSGLATGTITESYRKPETNRMDQDMAFQLDETGALTLRRYDEIGHRGSGPKPTIRVTTTGVEYYDFDDDQTVKLDKVTGTPTKAQDPYGLAKFADMTVADVRRAKVKNMRQLANVNRDDDLPRGATYHFTSLNDWFQYISFDATYEKMVLKKNVKFYTQDNKEVKLKWVITAKGPDDTQFGPYGLTADNHMYSKDSSGWSID